MRDQFSGPASWHGSRRRLALLAAAALAAACGRAGGAAGEPKILTRPGEIEFPAVVGGRAFDDGVMMAGYHAIVWKGGRAAHFALLRAEVSDRAVLDALSKIAPPGPTLPMEAWDERDDPNSAAPDLKASGPSVEILLRVPGREALVPLADIVQDAAGRGFEFRFAGNAANIPKWESGCIVCLYSCPGGKIGNARYTDRDYARHTTRFTTRPGSLPPEGTRVGVVLRVRERMGPA